MYLQHRLNQPKTIKQDEIQIKVSKNTPTGQSEILAPGDIGTSGTEGETIYIIGNTEELTITINGKQVNPNVIPSNEGKVNNTGVITISPNTIKQDEIQIKVSKNSPTGQSEILVPGDIGTSGIEGETVKIITNKIPQGEIWYIRSIQTINRTTLESYPLENLS